MAKERHNLVTQLRQRRAALGITQVAHAEAAGLPIETLKCWEYAGRAPNVTTLEAAARALGLTVKLVEM